MENFAERLYWFRLGTWLRNDLTSVEWSRMLSEQLDYSEEVEILSEHTALVGNLVVWISNFPYAYGNSYSGTSLYSSSIDLPGEVLSDYRNYANRNYKKYGSRLPDRKTVLRLRKAVEKARAAL